MFENFFLVTSSWPFCPRATQFPLFPLFALLDPDSLSPRHLTSMTNRACYFVRLITCSVGVFKDLNDFLNAIGLAGNIDG